MTGPGNLLCSNSELLEVEGGAASSRYQRGNTMQTIDICHTSSRLCARAKDELPLALLGSQRFNQFKIRKALRFEGLC